MTILSDPEYKQSETSVDIMDEVKSAYFDVLASLRQRNVSTFIHCLEHFRRVLFKASAELAICQTNSVFNASLDKLKKRIEHLEVNLKHSGCEFMRQENYALLILKYLRTHYNPIVDDQPSSARHVISMDDYYFLCYVDRALSDTNIELRDQGEHPLLVFLNETDINSKPQATQQLNRWYEGKMQQEGLAEFKTLSNEKKYHKMTDFYLKTGLLVFVSRFMIAPEKLPKVKRLDEERLKRYSSEIPSLVERHVVINERDGLTQAMKRNLIHEIHQIKSSVSMKLCQCSLFNCRGRSVYQRRLRDMNTVVENIRGNGVDSVGNSLELSQALSQLSVAMNRHANVFSAIFLRKKTNTALAVDRIANRCRYLHFDSEKRRDGLRNSFSH